jgi:hypothetical protein
MFGWGLTLLSTLVLAYVAWRSTSVPWLAKRVGRRTLWIAFACLWALMAAGRTLGHDASFPGSAFLEFTGMTLLGILFLCFMPLLVVDLATGFGFGCRASAPRLRGWALLGGLALSGFASFQGLREPEVVEYEVQLPGLPQERDGLVVVALADLHLGSTLGPRWLEARIAQVHALRPDLVLLLGDVFEGHGRPEERVIKTLRTLHAPLGIWGVDGNHERHGTALSPLDEAGVRVLRNACATAVPGLALAGRSESGRHGAAQEAIWNVPAERPQGALVLLAHIPQQVEEAARSGATLMLSGHTHGGQIWPFSYLTGRVYPTLAGKAQIEGMTLIINRGTGTWGPRMRLWRRSEISRITLSSRRTGIPGAG